MENNEVTLDKKIEVLNKSFTFPSRVVLYLAVNSEKEYSILMREQKDKKKKIENFRLKDLEIISFSHVAATPLVVFEANNAMEIIEKADEYGEMWVKNNG